MSLSIEYWPFQKNEERLPEETEQWWQTCYVRHDALTTLAAIERSVAVVGSAGCGKSIVLAALQRDATLNEYVLMFNYAPRQWPGQPHAYVADGNHLAQLMANAAEKIKSILVTKPHLLTELSELQQGFLRWLIEKRGGRRALLRWADSLQTETAKALAQTPFEDIYPSDHAHADVKGQIEELINVAHGMGYQRIMALIDVPSNLNPTLSSSIGDLLGWLEPLQHPGFELKLALPYDLFTREQIASRSRGRVSLTSMKWTRDQVRQLAKRHLAAATNEFWKSLEELITPGLLQRIEDEIETLFGQPSPRGWIGITHTLLTLYDQTKSCPLKENQYAAFIRQFYGKWAPLRLALTDRGVWRGPQFIPLDEQPYNFLRALWHAGGDSAGPQLRQVAGSSANVNTLASRVRKRIEPDNADGWVYLHSSRSEGYWLEHTQQL